MTPEKRIELYLNYIITGEGPLPEAPDGRLEQYLNRLATGSGQIPLKPETRIEQYLSYKILGTGTLPDKPNTKIEIYLNYAITKTGDLPAPDNRLETLFYKMATKPPATDSYATIYYYPVVTDFAVEFSDGCTVNGINATQLSEWFAEQGISDDMADFDYYEEQWRCMGIEIDDMSVTGIDVSLDEGATSAFFMLVGEKRPDMEKPMNTYVVTTADDYNVLSSTSGDFVFSGATIPRNGIIKFVFGELATTAPRNFLVGCCHMNEVIMGENLIEVGINFLVNSKRLTAPIDLSHLERVGTCFMGACELFNQPIDVSNIKVCGANFMSNCSSFDQPIILSSLEEINSTDLSGIVNNFLYGLNNFNSIIEMPKLAKFTGPYATTVIYLIGQLPVFTGTFTIPATFTSNQENIIPFAYMSKSATLVVNSSNVGANLTSSNAKYVCTALQNTSESYTQGIKISGTYASEFVGRFPNKTTPPNYRKLVLV